MDELRNEKSKLAIMSMLDLNGNRLDGRHKCSRKTAYEELLKVIGKIKCGNAPKVDKGK